MSANWVEAELRALISELEAELQRQREELTRLQEWKESATALLNEWDTVHEALGHPARLGESIVAASRREALRLRSRASQEGRVVLDPVGETSIPKEEIRRAVHTVVDGKQPPGPDYVPPPPKPLVGGRDC